MNHGRQDDFARHRVERGLADSLTHKDVDLGVWVGHERGQASVVDASIAFRVDLGLVFPVALQDADFAHEGVHEGAVHLEEAAVVAVNDEIGVLCRLLGSGNVFWPLRDKLNRAVGAMEDAHQRRDDGLYGIPYVHAHNLAAPLFLIAERFAAVIFCRAGACWGDPVVDVVDRVVDLLADDALQLLFGHLIWVQHLFDVVHVIRHLAFIFIHLETLLCGT